jgi:hypothetical protein
VAVASASGLAEVVPVGQVFSYVKNQVTQGLRVSGALVPGSERDGGRGGSHRWWVVAHALQQTRQRGAADILLWG